MICEGQIFKSSSDLALHSETDSPSITYICRERWGKCINYSKNLSQVSHLLNISEKKDGEFHGCVVLREVIFPHLFSHLSTKDGEGRSRSDVLSICLAGNSVGWGIVLLSFVEVSSEALKIWRNDVLGELIIPRSRCLRRADLLLLRTKAKAKSAAFILSRFDYIGTKDNEWRGNKSRQRIIPAGHCGLNCGLNYFQRTPACPDRCYLRQFRLKWSPLPPPEREVF